MRPLEWFGLVLGALSVVVQLGALALCVWERWLPSLVLAAHEQAKSKGRVRWRGLTPP